MHLVSIGKKRKIEPSQVVYIEMVWTVAAEFSEFRIHTDQSLFTLRIVEFRQDNL